MGCSTGRMDLFIPIKYLLENQKFQLQTLSSVAVTFGAFEYRTWPENGKKYGRTKIRVSISLLFYRGKRVNLFTKKWSNPLPLPVYPLAKRWNLSKKPWRKECLKSTAAAPYQSRYARKLFHLIKLNNGWELYFLEWILKGPLIAVFCNHIWRDNHVTRETRHGYNVLKQFSKLFTVKRASIKS